ncbi:Putative helicase MOV-10 [Cytospora mali]|uniref:Helicase MOV-10 n=1 Tax=Cytospora mali TaxID=578113 RepID=A0A194WAU8_CYTMA|nr:Putative helicase MOV-10 [Valsa mali]
MFVKPPTGSKAIPIVKPAEDENKNVDAKKRPSFAKMLPSVQEIAIQQAANAITSLNITSKPSEAVTVTVPFSEPESVPISVPMSVLDGNHRKPGDNKMTATEPQKKRLAPTDDDDQDYEAGFNIYARPFIPEIFTVINTLPGRQVLTDPKKTIDFDDYIARSLGPAAGFLPQPLPMYLPTATSSFTEAGIISPEYYEEFFQFHLHQEIQAQKMENETYSLYGHEVSVQPQSVDFQQYQKQGEAICILQVPGLRENSPFVEEDDVIELRQLLYGADGSLYGMQAWLAARKAIAANASLPVSMRSVSQQGPALGWTNTIYFARVHSIVRAQEKLVLRVLGFPGNVAERTEKFNIQFPCPPERHLPMLFALPVAQQALLQYDGHDVAHRGYSQRSTSLWLHSMLFPTTQDCEIQDKLHPGIFRSFFDDDLNWEQKKAVESIWSQNYGNLPFLISGPPGTGKTKTVIESALQLIKNTNDHSHVLLCAPSDPAADTLAQRLREHLTTDEMLRLNRPCRTFAEVPDPLLQYCCIIDEKFALPAFPTIMQYRVVVTTCRDASMLSRARLTNSDLYTLEQELNSITMCIHPLDFPPQVKLHWSALIVDEAAQATEPEVLVPLTIVAPPINPPNTFKPVVVMAGDEHQLGPRTSLPSSPLKKSLFARLFKLPVYAAHPLARGKTGEAPPPLTQSLLPIYRPPFANLIRNYRSHPAILAVPSSLFYADTLEPEAKNTNCLQGWDGWNGRGWPVLFHDNPSRDELEMIGLREGMGGWHNAGEVEVACHYAASLVASGLVEQSEVCIMSPFNAQVRRLRQRMRDPQYGGLWGVNIGPTEAFQGLERGVVILCVTRSRQKFVEKDQQLGWGIIGMPNKMNVALTRAKSGLIVIGRRSLLMEDPNWKAFVEFCERNGLVRGDTASGSQPGHGLTRLEKKLLEKERGPELQPFYQGWGMNRTAEPGEEMWTNGMLETPSYMFEDIEDRAHHHHVFEKLGEEHEVRGPGQYGGYTPGEYQYGAY